MEYDFCYQFSFIFKPNLIQFGFNTEEKMSNKAFRHVEILYKNLLTIYIVKEICEWNKR